MKSIRKFILTIALGLVCWTPSRAVFNERDLSLTLQVLRYELHRAYEEMEKNQLSFEMQDDSQHEELIGLIRRCNELSLMLYSQKQDFTFDLTYALQQASDQYHSFNKNRMPYDNIISYLDVEIVRYDRLIRTLKLLPPELEEVPDSLGPESLDSLAQMLRGRVLLNIPFSREHAADPEHAGHNHDAGLLAVDSTSGRGNDLEHFHSTFKLDSLSMIDRDSCLFYCTGLLKMFTDLRDHLIEDNLHYEMTNARLKEAYDYAQERYKLVQRKIFVEGQNNSWYVLTHLRSFSKRAFGDFRDKYGRDLLDNSVNSEWRGPIVVGFSFIILVYLIIAYLISLLLIKILKRGVRLFESPGFEKREFPLILLFSVILFVNALFLMRLSPRFGTNFFQMASALLIEFTLLLIAIISSMLIRHTGAQINRGLKLFAPVLMIGLMVISFRITFIPNSLITLVFPPALLFLGIWQTISFGNNGNKVPDIDKYLAVISIIVTVVTLGISVFGYVLLGLQLYIWWIFQLTALQLIIAVKDLLKKYRRSRVDKLVRAYRIHHLSDVGTGRGAYVLVTWLYDLFDMVVIPLLFLLSIPFCLYMASKVFDLKEVCMNAFYYPFINTEYVRTSLYMIILALGLYYIFYYIAYLSKSLYRIYKVRYLSSKSGTGLLLENEVNMTLANNVIWLIVWGIYIITLVILLGIPTKSLSVITAGLAAGLGFAMKDILNNFFYGVQLMSGRLRVGDTLECDGIRGTVENISYQTTTIRATDGSHIAFPNSSLFAKTFKNLTRIDAYEYVALPVGVAYGTDVEKARKVIRKALAPLCVQDRFGREMVKPSYGIQIVLSKFGSSRVDLMVKQYVLVDQRFAYVAKANEEIYKAFGASGIEIPFPQQDIYIKKKPEND